MRRPFPLVLLVACALFQGCSSVQIGEQAPGWRVVADGAEPRSVEAAPIEASRGRPRLLGDPGGARSALEERGISLGLTYTSELLTNARGGVETGSAFHGNLDLTLEIDFEKLGLWKGGKLFAYGLHDHRSDSLNERFVGDLQVASNIDAPDGTRLYELWFEQTIVPDTLSVLVGQHDLNSEFAVTETGGLFLNSSFGIQPDIAANAPLSIFPAAGLAARIHFQMTEWLDLRVGIYDGDPGDPEINRSGARWRLSSEEGALLIGEIGVHIGQEEGELPGSFKVGTWFHTADFELLDDEEATRGQNYGVYAIADQMLFREERDQGLSIFVQLGGAPRDRNEVPLYLGAGVVYRGLFPGRDEDEIGLALARAWVSGRLAGRSAGETAVELVYRAQVTPWLALQPDLQLILDPGADPDLRDALVAGLRVEIEF